MTWDSSSSPLFPGNDIESRMMLPMASPPLDAISLGPLPMELEHNYHPYNNLDRRLVRLQQDILLPLEKFARGSFSSSSYSDAQETHAMYNHPLPRSYGKDNASAFIGSYYTGEFDYPSPSSHGVASMSGTDERSPSPSYVPFGPYSMDAGSHFLRWGGGGNAAQYESVTPRDVLHEAMYPEPVTPVDQKVPQIFPCASIDQTQDETLNDLAINDDVDADGEPDAMCDDCEESKPVLTNQRASRRMPPKTKKGLRDGNGSRKCAAVAATTIPTQIPKSPIRKRPAASRKSSQTSTRNSKARTVKDTTSSSSAAAAAAAGKTYSCSFKQYGCESTFSTKNEWKRHFASQHLKIGFYRCDLKGCQTASKGPNDFNRKDLFTQHLRRMHAPWVGRKTIPTAAEKEYFEKTLDQHADRCWDRLREPPVGTSCGCEREKIVFENWSKRMEHMSKHYERDSQFEEGRDENLETWAVREGILCLRDSSSNELILTDLVHKRR